MYNFKACFPKVVTPQLGHHQGPVSNGPQQIGVGPRRYVPLFKGDIEQGPNFFSLVVVSL